MLQSALDLTANKSETIYGLIRDQQHQQVIDLLEPECANYPKSRCLLSMLAYCYYYIQDFHSAANKFDIFFLQLFNCV